MDNHDHERSTSAAQGDALFRALAEHATEGIGVADGHGRYVYANPAFCMLSGYTPEQLQGMQLSDLLPEGIDVELFPHVVREGQGVRELPLLREDGSQVMVEVSGTYLRLDGNTFVLGVIKDISERLFSQDVPELSKENSRADTTMGTDDDIIPICANCKRIRGEDNSWQEVEAYSKRHFATDFSHAICPACTAELFPDMYEEIKEEEILQNRAADTASAIDNREYS